MHCLLEAVSYWLFKLKTTFCSDHHHDYYDNFKIKKVLKGFEGLLETLKEMNQSDKQTAKTTSSFGLKSVLFSTNLKSSVCSTSTWVQQRGSSFSRSSFDKRIWWDGSYSVVGGKKRWLSANIGFQLITKRDKNCVLDGYCNTIKAGIYGHCHSYNNSNR